MADSAVYYDTGVRVGNIGSMQRSDSRFGFCCCVKRCL